MRTRYSAAVLVAAGLVVSSAALAAPYASNVTQSGTTVSFILNEPADVLNVSINGGPRVTIAGAASKGTKSFTLGSPTDTYSILAGKTDTVGYKIPTGGTIAVAAGGLSQITNESGLRLITDDANPLGRFNSPRGISVALNPAAPNFGTTYVANSAAGTVAANTPTGYTLPARTLTGDGLYAVRADQSDAFGFNNAAQNGGITNWAATPSASAPFRIYSHSDGNVYISDFSDATGTVWRMSNNLTGGSAVLAGIGGPTALPAGQNHGSTTAVYVEGSQAGGNLSVYTLDEDLTTLQVSGAGSAIDKNSLWKYSVNGSATPYSAMPTKVGGTVLLTGATSDLTRGADGKFYVAQNRSGGAEAGLWVLDSAGSVIFDSLNASRTLLANPAANDIFRNVLAMDVSADQKWMAVMLNGSDVAVVPLVNGIPDIANRLVVNTGSDVNSGRDIAFDAAGNIHYVSSGQALYRSIAPGGVTYALTENTGGVPSFRMVPEPAALAAIAGVALIGLRRRK